MKSLSFSILATNSNHLKESKKEGKEELEREGGREEGREDGRKGCFLRAGPGRALLPYSIWADDQANRVRPQHPH